MAYLQTPDIDKGKDAKDWASEIPSTCSVAALTSTTHDRLRINEIPADEINKLERDGSAVLPPERTLWMACGFDIGAYIHTSLRALNESTYEPGRAFSSSRHTSEWVSTSVRDLPS